MRTCQNILELPSDCKSLVCSYLSLHGCIHSYGISCHQALDDIVPDLIRRRNQFLQTSQKSKHGTDDSGINSNQMTVSTPKDRIQCLSQSLPQTHPSNNLVHELYTSISSLNVSEIQTNNNLSRYQSNLHQISKALKNHKLHSQILSQAVSLHHSNSSTSLQDERSFTTKIDQYIGNILIASLLLPNLDIVHGGIRVYAGDVSTVISSEIHWFRLVHLQLKLNSLNVTYWYSAWILIHSSLVRFVPTNEDQRKRLGLKYTCAPAFPSASVLSSGPPQEKSNDYKYPPLIHIFPLAPPSQRVRSELSRIVVAIRDIPQVRCIPHYSIRDFGPLGPAFRGRDHLRLFSVDQSLTCIVLLNLIQFVDSCHEEGLSSHWNSYSHEQQRQQYERVHRDASLNLDWMYDVHQETFKRRPMTVNTPTVQFQVIT